MVSATEGASAKQGLAADLAAGLAALSEQGAVTFNKYVRLVLPLDGYVYWVRTAETLTAKGSFHYSTIQVQNEAETEGASTVLFSSLVPIQQFNVVSPEALWVGEYGGDREGYDGPVTFAFSSRGRYYQTADLFHYSGTAVLPALKAQLINAPSDISTKALVVSDSLPLWLALNSYVPPYPGFVTGIKLYPSFLIPDNLPPPYGAVHIEPSGTESDQAAPWFGPTLSQLSLSRDKVRVTLYGLTNDQAETFLAAVMQYSYDYDVLGLCNLPTVRDEKRTAPELGVIAMKKTIEFEVSYNQGAVRLVARQMIEKDVNRYLPQPLTAVGFVPPAP